MNDHGQPPSSIRAGLLCRCPRCGEGALFQGFLKLRESCGACGLSFKFAEPADGPAFFVMTAAGILVTAAWAIWAFTVQPPIWLQLAVILPGFFAACLATLRPTKAWLVAEQYINKAEEGRWASLGTHGKAPPGYMRRGR